MALLAWAALLRPRRALVSGGRDVVLICRRQSGWLEPTVGLSGVVRLSVPAALTVFPKTRSAETAEVARALHAQKICEAEHGTAHQVFDREVN